MILLDQDLFTIEVFFNVCCKIEKSTLLRWGKIEDRVKQDAWVSFQKITWNDLRSLFKIFWKENLVYGEKPVFSFWGDINKSRNIVVIEQLN